MSRTHLVVQARYGSERLVGKVMQHMMHQPMLLWMLDRACRIDADTITVAMPSTDKDKKFLAPMVSCHGYRGFMYDGPENDVLSRFAGAVATLPEVDMDDTVVRLTGDCPLLDPDVVNQALQVYYNEECHYISMAAQWPDGLDFEAFPVWLLMDTHANAKKVYEREHVTPYIWNNNDFVLRSFECPFDLSQHKWSVDEASEFGVVESLLGILMQRHGRLFDWFDVYSVICEREEFYDFFTSRQRNVSFVRQMAEEDGFAPTEDWNQIRYGKDAYNVPDVSQ